MSLTPTDYENIELLFNTTQQIFYYYCKLIKMEKNSYNNNSELSIISKKFDLMGNVENNLILSLGQNSKKIELVMNEISEKKYSNNPYLSKRILIKLDRQLGKLLFRQFSKDNQNALYKLQRNNLIQNEFKHAIVNDIFNTMRFYLNNEINGKYNDYIVSQLIDFKYKDLFLGLDYDNDVFKYKKIKSILLCYDFVCDFMQQFTNTTYSESEKELLKNLIVQEKLFSFAEEILIKDNSIITNEDEMIKIIILKSYVKACLCLLDDRNRESVVDFLKRQGKNTISKNCLISAIEENERPTFKTIRLKIK